MNPGELLIGDRRGHEVRKAVDRLHQIARTAASADVRAVGAGNENLCHAIRRHVRLPCRIHRRFQRAGERVSSWPEFDRQEFDDVPALAEIAGEQAHCVAATPEHFDKPTTRAEHVVVDREAARGRFGGIDSIPAAFAPIYSRAQLFVPMASPPIVVATMPNAYGIC